MEDRANQVIAVAAVFFILTWITVGLRVYVRSRMIRTFGLDDWLMVVTLVLFTLYLICQLGGVRYGTGRHMKDLELHNAEAALRFWFMCEIFYVASSCMLKIAVGCLLLRVSLTPMHVWIIRIMMVATAIFGIIYEFILMFQCHPISNFWNLSPGQPPMQGCLDPMIIVNVTYTAGALNSVADWVFGILPFFIVWNLKMAKKAKYMVAGILTFAAIGSIATLIRIPYVKTLAKTDDFLFSTTNIAIWSTIEVGIGTTAACMVTLRPLFQNILFKTGLSSSPSSNWISKLPNLEEGQGGNDGVASRSRGMGGSQGRFGSKTMSRQDKDHMQLNSMKSMGSIHRTNGEAEDWKRDLGTKSGAGVTTTTITGQYDPRNPFNSPESHKKSQNQDRIYGAGEMRKGMGGISKSEDVVVTYEEVEESVPSGSDSSSGQTRFF